MIDIIDKPFHQDPLLVFCRQDFIGAVERCWVNSDTNHQPSNDGLDLEKLKRVCSFDDIAFNAALAWQALSCELLDGLAVNIGIPILGNWGTPAEIMDGALAQYPVSSIIDYFYGRNLGYSIDPNPVDDQYKLLAKGNYLFVGIEPGFVATMENHDKQREFLTNCLEMCRNTMQNPALFQSSLYRRFVFTNVNV